jgi:hypothetical protein
MRENEEEMEACLEKKAGNLSSATSSEIRARGAPAVGGER